MKKVEEKAKDELKEIIDDLFGKLVENKSEVLVKSLNQTKDELEKKIVSLPSLRDFKNILDDKIGNILPVNLKKMPNILGTFENKETTIAKLLMSLNKSISTDLVTNRKMENIKKEINSIIEQKVNHFEKKIITERKKNTFFLIVIILTQIILLITSLKSFI